MIKNVLLFAIERGERNRRRCEKIISWIALAVLVVFMFFVLGGEIMGVK